MTGGSKDEGVVNRDGSLRGSRRQCCSGAAVEASLNISVVGRGEQKVRCSMEVT